MAKPEWGTKRMCQSCGTRFYDLGRETPTCPKCGAVYAPRTTARPRRAAAGIVEPAPAPAPVPVPTEAATAAKADTADETIADEAMADLPEDEDEEDAAVETMDEDEDDESLMEDASELGEDEDDVSEVMEHVDDGDLSDRS